jgi:hypothetical protein
MLIKSCIHPNITTSIIASITRSICFYHFGNSSTITRKSLEKENKFNIQNLLKDTNPDGEEFCKLLNEIIEDNLELINLLIQLGMENNERSIYSIAILSSISPIKLIQQLDSLKTINTNISINEDIDTLCKPLNGVGGIEGGLKSIDKLTQMNKNDEKVVQSILKFLQTDIESKYTSEKWRERAAISLRQFPSR